MAETLTPKKNHHTFRNLFLVGAVAVLAVRGYHYYHRNDPPSVSCSESPQAARSLGMISIAHPILGVELDAVGGGVVDIAISVKPNKKGLLDAAHLRVDRDAWTANAHPIDPNLIVQYPGQTYKFKSAQDGSATTALQYHGTNLQLQATPVAGSAQGATSYNLAASC